MVENAPIPPHGGTLVNLLAAPDEAATLADQARNLPKVAVSERELSDLEMLAVGALSPLTGFQGEADYRSILETMHLANGTAWAIPVTLSLSEDEAKRIGGTDAIALSGGPDEEPIAVLKLDSIFRRDKQRSRPRSTAPRISSTRV